MNTTANKPEIIVYTKPARIVKNDKQVCKGCYQTTLLKPQGR